jgi:hypothetical protein
MSDVPIPNASKYTFLPWVKTGSGTIISNNEQDLRGPRAKIRIDLKVGRFDRSNNPKPEVITKDFQLYGPSDIKGILNSLIIRTSPRANDHDVEPNYFPYIEFSQADFPWRYTPAMPSRTQTSDNFEPRLSPWISLIVLREGEFERSNPAKPDLLPQIRIYEPRNSLPDLEQSWGWAHTQIAQQVSDAASLRKILTSEPHNVTSRILALRKLEPNTRYFAFLVPSFEVGRLSGIGMEINDNMIGTSFAWKVSSSEQHVLPIYYQWQFSTSVQRGDFESLVAKLRHRRLSENIGLRKLDVSEPFLSIGKKTGLKKPLYFGGALWSSEARKKYEEKKKIDIGSYSIPNDDSENPSPEEIKKFIMEMKSLVDLGERSSWTFVNDPSLANKDRDPIISPPMYGKWPANKRLISKISDDYNDPEWIATLIKSLDINSPEWFEKIKPELEKIKADTPYEWLEQLNLDPTNRVAAGLGSAVIQDLQEELVTSAWDQAGPIREANKRLRVSQLARTISSNIFERCFVPMDHEVLIRLVGPLHSKVILVEKKMSVATLIHESPIPDAVFSPSFTKITAERSKIYRKLFDRNTRVSSTLLNQLNTIASNRDARPASLVASESNRSGLLVIDYLLSSPVPDLSVKEDEFQGNKLKGHLSDSTIAPQVRLMVKNTEVSIPPSKSTDDKSYGATVNLENIRGGLLKSLDPAGTRDFKGTIESKISMEVTRPERLEEEKKDLLDPIVAYPEFIRPMFEPLRELSKDILLPGVEDIPSDTISLLETNPFFINSYMVGLNHEMARELLWREYPTDQRGSYFRQFWDVSVAIQRERLEHFHTHGDYPTVEEDQQIIEKYRDIPEIHKWKHSSLEGVLKDSTQPPVFLIKGELLNRFPSAIIYASKAVFKNGKLDLPPASIETEDKQQTKQPIFRGTIPPDVTFLGFDLSEKELRGDNNTDPGYFFIIQEPPSELRFGIDEPSEPRSSSTVDPDSLESWDKLDWDYITLLPESNRYIDLEGGTLKGKHIIENGLKVMWGSHAADLANILLQRPVRIAVHARELLKEQES